MHTREFIAQRRAQTIPDPEDPQKLSDFQEWERVAVTASELARKMTSGGKSPLRPTWFNKCPGCGYRWSMMWINKENVSLPLLDMLPLHLDLQGPDRPDFQPPWSTKLKKEWAIRASRSAQLPQGYLPKDAQDVELTYSCGACNSREAKLIAIQVGIPAGWRCYEFEYICPICGAFTLYCCWG